MNTKTRPRYLQALEATAYVAIIAICGTLLYQQLFSSAPVGNAAMPSIAAGDQHASLAALVPEGQDQALVVAVSPNCPYCEKSMPFYQKFLEQRSEQGASLPLIAAVDEYVVLEQEQETLARHQVTPDTLVQLNTQALNILGVPTMLLVKRSGEVKQVWRGYQDEAQQEEILKQLL